MKPNFHFNRLSMFIIAGLILTSFSCSSQRAPEWKPLFNGKDLDDWEIKITGHELNENYGNTFKVEDGKIQVRYDQYDHFEERYGHLFYKETFSSYLIGIEYRFTGEQVEGAADWAYRNSGIMLHGQHPATMDVNQHFPTSIEVQLLGGDGSGERSTANLCTPGTQVMMDEQVVKIHCINSDSPTFLGEEWIRVEVLVLQDSLMVHYVNGEEVLRYERPQLDPLDGAREGELIGKGSISLQSESHPVDFRKVEIVDLEPYENNPEAMKKLVATLMSEKRAAAQ